MMDEKGERGISDDGFLQPGQWKLKVTGDIEPSFESVAFASADEVGEFIANELSMIADKCALEGDSVTFTIEVIRMSDEEYSQLEPYDPYV